MFPCLWGIECGLKCIFPWLWGIEYGLMWFWAYGNDPSGGGKKKECCVWKPCLIKLPNICSISATTTLSLLLFLRTSFKFLDWQEIFRKWEKACKVHMRVASCLECEFLLAIKWDDAGSCARWKNKNEKLAWVIHGKVKRNTCENAFISDTCEQRGEEKTGRWELWFVSFYPMELDQTHGRAVTGPY